MPKYRRIPVVIDAIQYTGENADEIIKEFAGNISEAKENGSEVKFLKVEANVKRTLLFVSIGDFIEKTAEGKIIVHDEKKFQSRYEAVKSKK